MAFALPRVVLLLSFVSLGAAQSTHWPGTWSASSGSRTLTGSWDATLGDNPNVAFGTWTLLDRAGKQLAHGTWSARKAEKTWNGGWQARPSSGPALSGTWRARFPIVSPTRLSDLFEFALTNVVNGSW